MSGFRTVAVGDSSIRTGISKPLAGYWGSKAEETGSTGQAGDQHQTVSAVNGVEVEAVEKRPGFEHPVVSVSGVVDRSFILLRFTLIIATSYLLIAEFGAKSIPVPLLLMMAVVLASNIGALRMTAERLRSPWFIGVTIVGDTVWITIALIATGRFTAEFFYLYFFVLFLAGVGENIRLIALSVTVVCLAYVVLIANTVGFDDVVTTQTLIRVPFLFSVAIFYGYLVDRLRRERRRLTQEKAVTEGLERNRRALAEANEELRRLSDVKSKFVSTVSHELKSPLTAIKNAVSLVDIGPDDEANEKFLQMIRRNADRLHAIILDLLDMSKVESGSLTIVARPLELGPFLAEVVESSESLAVKSEVSLEFELQGDLPKVVGDASRIEQVVTNLISNGLKATPSGGTVTVRAEQISDDRVTISVTDTGIGLSEEDREQVFEPFFQAAKVLDGKPAGTGLGLTICRDLVRGHGGEIQITSELGQGSTFSFPVPVISDRAYETIAFENQVRTNFRAHPYFSVLIADCGTDADDVGKEAAKARFERVRKKMDSLTPRALDVLCEQPAHGRIIVVLLSTPLAGGWVVKKKLARAFADDFKDRDRGKDRRVKVYGPAGFPENGDCGTGLIEIATGLGEALEEEV
jgi:signal transduction histidine kinase